MVDHLITLSDFSNVCVSARLIQTANDVYHVFIESYNLELVIKKDENNHWEYLSSFSFCNPRWLKEIVSQIYNPPDED
jgi:hypothetical protein